MADHLVLLVKEVADVKGQGDPRLLPGMAGGGPGEGGIPRCPGGKAVFRAGTAGGEAGAGEETADVKAEIVPNAPEVEAGAVEGDVRDFVVVSGLARPLERVSARNAGKVLL